MEKQALKLPNLFRGYKGAKGSVANVGKPPIIRNTSDMALENGHKMFDEKAVQDAIRKKDIDEGNGLVADALTGGTKMVANGVHRLRGGEGASPLAGKIDEGVANMKGKLRSWDTSAGSFLGGKNDGMRARIFSTPEKYKVGEQTLENGVADINKEVRRASLTAPITNTTRVATPILASLYVGEKMFGDGDNPDPNQPTEQALAGRAAQEFTPKMEQGLGRTRYASENPSDGAEKHGIVKSEESIAYELEKKAAFDKIAMLENEIEKLGSEVNYYREEAAMFEKTAMIERSAKEEFKKRALISEIELAEKTAAHREYELRVAARERSKVAVSIADSMLKTAQIKQVDYDKTIDHLMDCDDHSFKMYASMVKEASTGDEALESLSFLQDDIVKDASETIQSSGMSGYVNKTGQTIGEAAASMRKTSK